DGREKRMNRQSEHSEAPAVAVGKNGPPSLIALPAWQPTIALTGAIALFLLAYLGVQTFRWGTTQSKGLPGLTNTELLGARANPLLMESDVGVSAALASTLKRICNNLPNSSDRSDCLVGVYPGASELVPMKIDQSPLVGVLKSSMSKGDPKLVTKSAFSHGKQVSGR